MTNPVFRVELSVALRFSVHKEDGSPVTPADELRALIAVTERLIENIHRNGMDGFGGEEGVLIERSVVQ